MSVRFTPRWVMSFVLVLLVIGGAALVGAQDTPSEQPYLGVRLADTDAGVVIAEIAPDSPAAAAELQVDDLLTSINGDAVADARAAVEAIRALAPGDTVTLDVTRADETLTLEATLGAREASVFPGRPGRGMGIGMDVGFEYDAEDGTLTLSRLTEDSPLYEAGLREGDVITQLNGVALTPETLADMMADADPAAPLTLTVERGDETLEIEIDPSTIAPMGMFGGMPGMGGRGGMDGRGGMFPGFDVFTPMGGRLGVAFENVTEALAQDAELTVTEGALIREVLADTPAADAGLQVDDVVTAVNGEPVDAERTLRDRLIAYEAGDTVTLTVVRGDETLDIEVTLAEPTGMMGMGFPFPGGMGGMMPGQPDTDPAPAPAGRNV
jgi:S1-C subfamily serine protease